MTIIDQVQEAAVSCDICGATATAAGKPFTRHTMLQHRSAAHSPRAKRKPKPTVEPLRCDICDAIQTKNGKPFNPKTLGIHKRHAHAIVGANYSPPKTAASVKTTTAALVPVKHRNGHRLNGETSTLDVALAVLGKVSPDGRIAVADLPEVLDWITQTHTIIERVSAR